MSTFTPKGYANASLYRGFWLEAFLRSNPLEIHDITSAEKLRKEREVESGKGELK